MANQTLNRTDVGGEILLPTNLPGIRDDARSGNKRKIEADHPVGQPAGFRSRCEGIFVRAISGNGSRILKSQMAQGASRETEILDSVNVELAGGRRWLPRAVD